jgi:hypothetical protein
MAILFTNFVHIFSNHYSLFSYSRFVLLITNKIYCIFYKSFLLIFLILVDGKIRRRRQYLYNNYGSYAIDPAVASYYGTGGGSYTGYSQQNNRLYIGGVAYQYPTPVNVFSGGSYNPQEYNAYPPGSDGYYYGKRKKDVL